MDNADYGEMVTLSPISKIHCMRVWAGQACPQQSRKFEKWEDELRLLLKSQSVAEKKIEIVKEYIDERGKDIELMGSMGDFPRPYDFELVGYENIMEILEEENEHK